MKHTIFTVALCFALFAGCRNETVIVNPEFDTTDADYMILSRIERTDTATVVYAGVYHLPGYWIYLSSKGKLRDSKGKTYRLLDCTGFQLDKEVHMPESGTMAFALSFEPVDRDEKVVDYIDLDENNETITGIKLYKVKHTEPVQCRLKGTVTGRPQSSRIALLRAGEDFRTAKVTYIPVYDGAFDYMLYAGDEEAYELIFEDEIRRGSWRPVEFIAESGTLEFTLNHEDEWLNNSIKGGKYTEARHAMIKALNEEMRPLYDTLSEKRRQLQEENRFYTPEMSAVHEQLKALGEGDAAARYALYDRLSQLEKEGKDLTGEAKALLQEDVRIYRTMYVDKLLDYAKTHADILGYTFLVENIRRAVEYRRYELDVSPMLAIFHDVYEKKYPRHPYTSLVQSYVQAAAIRTGNPCPDVTALDAGTGREVRLSELMKGRVTLVHLWASWCGPCRNHGREMIPVYEQYRDKGFTVVGIAREQKKEAMAMAVERDQYPWVNLLELNDEHGIWTKFGIGNAGGGEFLVDAQGRFLAVNATPGEMKKILQELFD